MTSDLHVWRWMTVATAAAVPALVGCQSKGTRAEGETATTVVEAETPGIHGEGYWVAHAVPSLTTIARDTAWSLVRRDDVDTIILNEQRTRPDGTTGSLTWLVSFTSPPSLETPVALDGTQAHGWLLEGGPGQRTFAVPLSGEVVVSERAAERLVARVNVKMNPRARNAVREDDDLGVGVEANVDLPRRKVHIPWQEVTTRTYGIEP